MSTAKALAAVKEMERHLGSWYLYGGDGPYRFDCSGLGHYSYRVAAGIHIGRVTGQQYLEGTKVARAAVKPGDGIYLVPQGGVPEHVIWVVDHATAIEAPHTGAVVRYSNIDQAIRYDGFVTIRRFTPWDAVPIRPQTPTLKLGAHGTAVHLMQERLVHHGFSVGKSGIDGVFGHDTLDALKAFEHHTKLKVDGVCGADDWKALLK